MKPDKQLDTLEDLLEYLMARDKTVVMQKLQRGEGFDLDDLILSLARKENDEKGSP